MVEARDTKMMEKISTLTSAVGLTEARYKRISFPENLTNGALTSGTSWTGAADFSSSGNKAVYTHNTGAGTYTQAVSVLATPGRTLRRYRFTYTVSSPSGTPPAIVITDAFAGAATALTGLGVAGTYSVDFVSAEIPGAFILSGTSGEAGAVSLDDLSLSEVVDASSGSHARQALVYVETAAIRACWDGSTPTITAGTGIGVVLNPGDSIYLETPKEIQQFRAINAVASNGATLQAFYQY